MVPAHGVSQSLADRLFVGTRRLDFQATMNQAAAILRSVTTLGDLLERFGLTIGQAVDTERVYLFLPEPEFYAQRFPAVQPGSRTMRMELHRDQAIIAHLERTQEPIVLDELHRVRSTPELERVRRQMNSLHIAFAMGIFSREQLAGVMLLGARAARAAFTARSSRPRSVSFAGNSRSRLRTRSSLPKCRTQKSTTRRCCKTSPPAWWRRIKMA